MDELTDIESAATVLVKELIKSRKVVATAESCTGGWIAKAITGVDGSSQCFGYGIVTYSNGAKESLSGVDPAKLNEHGAVSEAVVREMAEGVLAMSGADYAVAVSGVAGPTGGSKEKPVGMVWFGWATRNKDKIKSEADRQHFPGDREDVRAQTVMAALLGIRERLRKDG